jgi:hypothetical protein
MRQELPVRVSSLCVRFSWMPQAMLTYNREAKEVQLAVDRSYTKGEPIEAWCGPQVRAFICMCRIVLFIDVHEVAVVM